MLYKSIFFVFIYGVLLCTPVCGQSRLNLQLVLQPGNSFIIGQWKNLDATSNSIFPAFSRNLTPGLETGVNAVFNFTGKAGGKVGYDEMYKSSFYFADKIMISTGLHYSFGGENYKDMKNALSTWSRKIGLSYLKIPLQIFFLKGKKEDNQLVYTAGFYISYLTRYKETNSTTGDNYEFLSVAEKNNITSTTSNPSTPGTPVTTIRYELSANPYRLIDFGMSLGVGMQKKLSDDLATQLIFIGQMGMADIKNTSAKYSDGTSSFPYYAANVNASVKHKNASLAVMIGLTKTFIWTPAPKVGKSRFRLFRFKGKE